VTSLMVSNLIRSTKGRYVFPAACVDIVKPISKFLVQSGLLFVKKDEFYIDHFILVCYGDGVVLALASSRGPGGCDCDFATDFTNDILMAKIQKVIDNALFPSKILPAR
jgi:hypothetical protein